jgi:hypothetical protein
MSTVRSRNGGSDTEEAPVLQRSCELRLELGAEHSDVADEQRSTGGQLDEPRLPRDGAAERTALVTEQLDVEHALGEQRAVRLDDRAGAPRETMNRPREETFARSRLAGDEHRRIRRRDALEQREHRVHRRVLRHDLGRRVRARETGLEISVLPRQLVLLPRAADQYIDLGHPIRFGQVVVRAELHRRDRGFDGAVAGDDDDLGRLGFGAQLAQHLEPVHLRHHDVDDGDVIGFVAERLKRRLAVADARHLVAAASQKCAEDLREILFIFGHEHANAAARLRVSRRALERRPVGSRAAARHSSPPPAGRRMRNTLPSPTVLSTSMRPPCSVTIA